MTTNGSNGLGYIIYRKNGKEISRVVEGTKLWNDKYVRDHQPFVGPYSHLIIPYDTHDDQKMRIVSGVLEVTEQDNGLALRTRNSLYAIEYYGSACSLFEKRRSLSLA